MHMTIEGSSESRQATSFGAASQLSSICLVVADMASTALEHKLPRRTRTSCWMAADSCASRSLRAEMPPFSRM